jgi:hypothetical protein
MLHVAVEAEMAVVTEVVTTVTYNMGRRDIQDLLSSTSKHRFD